MFKKQRTKGILLLYLILFSTIQAYAQEGLFAKFSLGSGYTTEHSKIKKSAHTVIAKNHAIGWGITIMYPKNQTNKTSIYIPKC